MNRFRPGSDFLEISENISWKGISKMIPLQLGNGLATLSTVTLQSDTAYNFIKSKIVSSEYPPDYFISTKKLASEIGVSRTPIRDAIRQLEQEGLVTVTPRYGAQVASLSLRQFIELWQIRVAFEGTAARLAAMHRTDDDLALLEVNLAAGRQLAKMVGAKGWKQSEGAEFTTNDRAFHFLLVRASRNELLEREVSRLHLVNLTIGRSVREEKEVERILKPPAETFHEHAAIMQAIKNRQSEKARDLMEKHLKVKDLEGTHRVYGHAVRPEMAG